jgi:type IV pilus assembly protein PilX
MATNYSKNESGVALIVVLVMLLILTILGINGAQNTIMEERMAGNYRDCQIAFEASESALRVAESVMLDDTIYDALKWDGTDGSYDIEAITKQADYDPLTDLPNPSSTDNSTIGVTSETIDIGSSQDPEYYIEMLLPIELAGSSLVKGYSSKPPTIQFHRITSYGYGKSPNTRVILQSHVF